MPFGMRAVEAQHPMLKYPHQYNTSPMPFGMRAVEAFQREA